MLRFWDTEILSISDSENLRYWHSKILRFWDIKILRFSDSEILRYWGSPKPKSRIIPLDSKVWKNIMKWSLSGSSGLGFCVNFLPWGGHPPPPYHPLFHPPARPWPQEGFLRFLGFGLPQGKKIRFRVSVFGLRFRVSGFQGKRLRFRVSVFGLRFRVWGSQGKKLRFLGFGPPPTTLFVSFWSFLDLFLMFFWFLGLTLLGSSLDAKSTLPKFWFLGIQGRNFEFLMENWWNSILHTGLSFKIYLSKTNLPAVQL